jgi:hypothetical protein
LVAHGIRCWRNIAKGGDNLWVKFIIVHGALPSGGAVVVFV